MEDRALEFKVALSLMPNLDPVGLSTLNEKSSSCTSSLITQSNEGSLDNEDS